MENLARRIATDIDVLSDLPSPSPVVARLSSTLGNDDVEVRTIEEIISQDPVVAGKVIHAANAAAYASHTPTASIRTALLRLGVIRVRRLAMLFGLFNAYPGPRVPEGFWQHSLAVGHLTDVVVQHMTVPVHASTDDVFIAGLLHDLGLLVLASHYSREYRAIREAAAQQQKPLDEVEDDVLGIDHGMIGEILAAHWTLPRPACAAIRGHHRIHLAGTDYRQHALIVHMAEAACSHAQLADIGEGVLLQPEDPAVSELGIGADSLTLILAEAQVQAERAAELVGFSAVGRRGR
ncbi:MAG TPA: HDOD domain-containing protein [Candidatus Bathyarchaeia archaeon]|nr:HDOD domain-containing protein [Candidatus Bathyarchaeia archaeon]